jgi:hypothetical protein
VTLAHSSLLWVEAEGFVRLLSHVPLGSFDAKFTRSRLPQRRAAWSITIRGG